MAHRTLAPPCWRERRHRAAGAPHPHGDWSSPLLGIWASRRIGISITGITPKVRG